MFKDFDSWNKVKKRLNEKSVLPFCNSREIWWCSLGLNVGSEQDGKNWLFERPVLILKVIFLLENSASPPRADALRLAPLEKAG